MIFYSQLTCGSWAKILIAQVSFIWHALGRKLVGPFTYKLLDPILSYADQRYIKIKYRRIVAWYILYYRQLVDEDLLSYCNQRFVNNNQVLVIHVLI